MHTRTTLPLTSSIEQEASVRDTKKWIQQFSDVQKIIKDTYISLVKIQMILLRPYEKNEIKK